MTSCRAVNLGQKVEIGQRVAVVGGGNTAIDAARVARRLGSTVTIVYRRGRDEMPANDVEIEAAEAEGIQIMLLTAPTKVIAEGGKVKAMECVKMKLGAPDASGRPRPETIPGSEFKLDVDTIIPALGQAPNLAFAKDPDVAATGRGTVKVDEASLATSVAGHLRLRRRGHRPADGGRCHGFRPQGRRLHRPVPQGRAAADNSRAEGRGQEAQRVKRSKS